MPALHELNPVTEIALRAPRGTRLRYDATPPGDLTHIDVNRSGRTPEADRWLIDSPVMTDHHGNRDRKIELGFDYTHIAVHDRLRFPFSQSLQDNKGTTCDVFLAAAAELVDRPGVRIRGKRGRHCQELPCFGRLTGAAGST